jgi:hypothetical protein
MPCSAFCVSTHNEHNPTPRRTLECLLFHYIYIYILFFFFYVFDFVSFVIDRLNICMRNLWFQYIMNVNFHHVFFSFFLN